ncbi:MAG: putative baseplate assembly protein, partial [Nitrososphaera sp.]
MDSCDCNCGCRDDKKYTPAKIYNPSGQPALSYRIGTHARFKSDMLLSIPSQPTLKYLKTREDSDLSIALMDSWALVADVLTFYQERIANEGFLRTATERRSLLELARSIGYELKPGVAASTYLAFSMDTSAGSPKKATIGIGIKVQSVPAQGESAQVFETMEEIVAQQAWNEIRPLQSSKQDLQAALEKGEVVFDGTSTKLKSG